MIKIQSLYQQQAKLLESFYELNKEHNRKTFYCIGGMGHVSSVAAGIALNNPSKKIVCLDGDGSSLMHMGFLPILGSLNLKLSSLRFK